MYRSQNSSIFQKQSKGDASYSHNEDLAFPGESFVKYGYQIADLQKKIDTFGAMDEVEEDIISELNRNSQRLDALTSKVRGFLKLQPNLKDRKSSSFVSYSPSPMQPSQKQAPKHTTSQLQKPQPRAMRLKDRVQKALQEQDSRNQNIQKQPKYIK